ncbi:PREDICTED: zinc finger protein 516 [Chrysochloris asiatica]|uniref:Zinc finger protein 516 n=1 Tax=Chrysochloris asiatica TaxID=185453 RepID=A0A9B0U921_CHRAS|nr:PREDICTED: zinc finger protein 516 [Chrysochloris asiatica]
MERNRDPETELPRGPEGDGDKTLYHSCCICAKSFPFQSSLSQHMRKHTGEKPYKCPYCDHRASQKGNLKIHIRSHRTGTLVQGHEPEAGEAPLGELRASEGLDTCASPTKSTSACNRILNGASQSDGDPGGKILLRSSRKEADVTGGEGSPCCPGAQEQPLLPAPRPFKCRLCSYRTLREDSLLNHIEKDHITAQVPPGRGVEPTSGGEFPCEVCGQAFSQTWFLKAHMKKHRGSFDHGCHICGRRFKEPWFLKNHLKAHGPKAASRNRHPRSELEPVATINDVVQEETIVSGLSLYEVCTKCGNLFTNLASLSAHHAVHRRADAGSDPGPADAQQRFLSSLSLRPAGPGDTQGATGRRVAELDPVSSYQAWQLATRGRVAEPAETLKMGGAEEVAGGAEAVGERSRRDWALASPDRRKREPPATPAPGPPRKRPSGPGEPSASSVPPGDLDYRPASRQARRAASAPGGGSGKSSECFECGKVFRTYHQMVLHSRVHRRAARRLPRPPARNRCGSLSDSASGPSSPGSASANDDSPGSGLADEAADDSGDDGTPESAPGAEPYRCGSPVEAAPAALVGGGQSRACGENVTGKGPGATETGVPTPDNILENSRDAPRRPEPRRLSLGLKMPVCHPKSEGTADADTLRPPQETPSSDTRGGDPPGAGPLDLSARSSRGAGGALQAALPVHPCPYCSHRTYYPEVLWVHKRIWHRVSGSAVAPPWVQPNGYKSVKNHLVFLARNGRTGPPPALGGKECQPLPVTRFARTQVPGAGPGPRGASPLQGVTSKASGPSRAKEGASCEPWAPGADAPPQVRSGLAPVHSSPSAPPRPRLEPTAQPTAAASVIARAGPPTPSKLVDKLGPSSTRSSPGPPPKHSAPDSEKAKFSPPPPCQPPGKGDGPPALPPREPPCKVAPEPRTMGGASVARGSPAIQAQPSTGVPPELRSGTQESPAEGSEKRRDILSIFKTYIPKDLVNLYQSWGSNGPTLEHRGMLRMQARQGELVCTECGKSFTQPSHLRAHTRAHTASSCLVVECEMSLFASPDVNMLPYHMATSIYFCRTRRCTSFLHGRWLGTWTPRNQLEDSLLNTSSPGADVLATFSYQGYIVQAAAEEAAATQPARSPWLQSLQKSPGSSLGCSVLWDLCSPPPPPHLSQGPLAAWVAVTGPMAGGIALYTSSSLLFQMQVVFVVGAHRPSAPFGFSLRHCKYTVAIPELAALPSVSVSD